MTETKYQPQVGDRVRVTHEGKVTTSPSHAGHFQIKSDNGVQTFCLDTATTVERIRPEVPTGLGAVVRLDGPDGPLVALPIIDPCDNEPWYLVGKVGDWLTRETVASRIHEVLSKGVDL